MASVSATCVRFETSFKLPVTSSNQMTGKCSRFVSLGWSRTGTLPSIRTKRLQICAAKPETVEKVCDVVRNRLALSAETELTPQTKFTELGADSLDTVEIVMELEEVFNISIEEDSSNTISTIQEAADLIEKLST